MDKLVFIVGKGKNAQFYKPDSDIVTVGRALGNDIVVSDSYVDAKQLKIVRVDNNSVSLEIFSKTNPVLLNGRPIDAFKKIVSIGDEIVVGRTTIAVVKESTQVLPTQKLLMARQLYSSVWRFVIPTLSLLLVFCFSVVFDVLQTDTDVQWSFIFRDAFVLCLAILFWSGAWALIGRLIKHQHHFFTHLLLACLFSILFMSVTPLAEYIAFAFDKQWLMVMVNRVLMVLLCTSLLGLCLKLVSSFRHSLLISAVLCSSILGALWVFDAYDADEFSPYADHFSIIKSPQVILVSPISVDEYLNDVERLFLEVEKNHADD